VTVSKTNRILLCLPALVGLISALVLAAPEKRITMKDLPEAVRKAAEEQRKGATIQGVSSEVEEGKTFYEVEMMKDGLGRDVTFDVNGKVVEYEEQVRLESLSKELRTAILKAAGKGTVGKVEAISKGGKLTEYEVHVTNGAQRSELHVKPDGTLLPSEEDEDDEEDEGD